MATRDEERAKRLAAALRDNLRKRKAQKRGEAAGGDPRAEAPEGDALAGE